MNHPSMFRLVGVPHRLFGETHVVVSIWREGSVLKAEYSILSKRPAEHLVQRVFEFDVADYPTELPPVDVASMEDDAVQRARDYLIERLEQLASDQGNEDLAFIPVELEREAITPVTLWARTVYPQAFMDMYNGTKSQDLKRYLQMVMSMTRFKPG